MRSPHSKPCDMGAAAAGSHTSRPPMAHPGQGVAPGPTPGADPQRPAPGHLPCQHGPAPSRRLRAIAHPPRHRHPHGLDAQNRQQHAIPRQPQPRQRHTPARRSPRTRPALQRSTRLAHRHHHRVGNIATRTWSRGRATPNLLTTSTTPHFISAQSRDDAAPPRQGRPPTRHHALPARQRYRADRSSLSRLFRGVECAPSLDTDRAPPHEFADMKKCQNSKCPNQFR